MFKWDEKSEIRPVTEVEAQVMSINFSNLAFALQTFANITQRHALHVLGLAALHDDKKFTANSASLTGGLSSRIAQGVISNYPILQVRKFLKEEEAPKYVIKFAATGIDTAIGVPFELNGSIKTLRALGVSVQKRDLIKMSAASFVPFVLRNAIVWNPIINEDFKDEDFKDNVKMRAVNAACYGAASTPFNNIGLKAAEASVVAPTWRELGENVLAEFTKKPKLLVKGLPQRTAATVGATFLLSAQATEFIEKVAKSILELEDVPSNSPVKATGEKTANTSRSK